MNKHLIGILAALFAVGMGCSDDDGGSGGEGGFAADSRLFGESCSSDDQCADSNGTASMCFAFGNGSKCTVACPADAADCPNSGAGCNNKQPAVCKTE